ncbi:hypothetical protein F8274_00005 [Micromonospora sp. AMSO31t]|nr:hypothetical protein F8274_00005 [Micromonospora sp. AMSO31t]
MPTDLVRGHRALRGTVEHRDGWTLLRTGDTTWALLGGNAADLPAGQSATVTGVQTAVPAGCPASRALTLR